MDDEFLDQFLSSSPWTEANDLSRSSWDSLQPFGGQFPTRTAVGNTVAEGSKESKEDGTTSILKDGNLNFRNERELHSLERLSEQTLYKQHSVPTTMSNDIYDGKFSFHGPIDRAGSFDSAVASRARTFSSSFGMNESEPSPFPQSFTDANSITSVSPIWPPSYSSISSIIGHGKSQDFGFQGISTMGETSFQDGKFVPLDAMHPASAKLQDLEGGHGIDYASVSTGQQMHLSSGDLELPKNAGCQTISSGGQSQSATAKTRVRARRGQATDPHSIAERLRREKIAERMKNLQEFVPNSKKADKAAMLDEIIDYVKFLQLQVKVLSMSRLGAAGAVVPLLTDVNKHTQGSRSLLLPSFGHDEAEFLGSEESLAFEQEVIRLMETNMKNAMQYLQRKGLCLMPIVLASAMSKPERQLDSHFSLESSEKKDD